MQWTQECNSQMAKVKEARQRRAISALKTPVGS